MSEEISYTTEEIAKILKISKLTVYDLIKKGALPSYRVGRQMRVDEADLEAYRGRSKAGSKITQQRDVNQVVITGLDVSLDILAKHWSEKTKKVRPLRSYAGSLDSLIAMYQGQADIVSCHLWDGDTSSYNIPYIRKILAGHDYIVIHLLSRSAGFYVLPNNPKQLMGWADLVKPGIKLVNREKGSGARVLLDEQLRLHQIPGRSLIGYENEQSHHLGVAGKVASGEADVGIGIEKVARMAGVDFIPLMQERYDLVMLKKPQNLLWIKDIHSILTSNGFRAELQALQSYDLTDTGKIVWET
jgi:putative molybdopterin biosynthesis protein